uniref:Uncharacterized protein n=1 Tax=Vitis vinifera TaxID=29760 RepID=F6H687_VITVI
MCVCMCVMMHNFRVMMIIFLSFMPLCQYGHNKYQMTFATVKARKTHPKPNLQRENGPSERDRIQMVLRSLQPKIARHVVGVPFTNFGSLVLALYDVEDGISRGLWTDSSPSDVKWKKPFGGQRSVDVSAISSTNQRPSRRHLPVPQLLETHPSYVPHQYRSRAPHPTYDQTYIPQTLVLPYYAAQDIERPPVSYTATGQPCYATQFVARPTSSHPRPRAQQASAPFALRTQRQFS